MERRLRAADVPVLYADPGIRWAVPLGALIREWEWWPSERVAIIADEPVGASPDNLCRIAAVVHALCDRDAVPVPDWVVAAPMARADRVDERVVDGGRFVGSHGRAGTSSLRLAQCLVPRGLHF